MPSAITTGTRLSAPPKPNTIVTGPLSLAALAVAMNIESGSTPLVLLDPVPGRFWRAAQGKDFLNWPEPPRQLTLFDVD